MPTTLTVNEILTKKEQPRVPKIPGLGHAVILSLLLATPSLTEAFAAAVVTVGRNPPLSTPTLLHMSDPDNNNNLPDFDDEEDCDDEEGCEIDWDAMPPFVDEDSDMVENDDEEEAVFFDDLHMAQERLQLSSQSKQVGPSVEQRRLHMEMQWQLTQSADECVVEKPETCGSEKCPDCHGRGWSDCRFCHGTTVLRMDKAAVVVPTNNEALESPSPSMDMNQHPTTSRTMGEALTSATTATPTTAQKKFLLPSSFSPCKICQQGVEVCRTCQGSGWIAAWTQIPSQSRTPDEDPLLP